MTAPAAVAQLVERFESHRETYRSGQYNEAQLREEFLNPFFHALGWDVYNQKGYAEAYKEVIHEDAIKVGGRTKAPDYCFRVGGGVRSFFVEAKKPSVDIRDAVSPDYQLRRYAWSAKLPVSILTDFEEWAVYDCRIRPAKTDRASTARVMYHTYHEYPQCWDELYGLFSPEAIRRGSLDKFVVSKRVKKGTAEVDDAFLNEIQTWRELLARNVALRNPKLSQRDLNFAVQRTIDRIVFLRICEDRGIEPYGMLQTLLNGDNVYRRLAELFQRADDRYNSGLFHFTPEKGRPEPPDELTLALAIDDRVLHGIIRDLYYPDSPYEFSVFPAEILGHVYEQFLGKVIRLTKGHRAVVEEKPEVKKAGGVYYTPAYIVDYIVQHTVGKLLHADPPTRSDPIHRVEPSTATQPARSDPIHRAEPSTATQPARSDPIHRAEPSTATQQPHECGHYERSGQESEGGKGRDTGKPLTPQAGRQAPHSRPGLRLGLVSHRGLQIPLEVAPRLVHGQRPGKARPGPNPQALPRPGGRLAAHHGRAEADPAEQHPRREPRIFSAPRILLREITAPLPYSLHATYVEELFLNNKSVLNVLHPEDNANELKFLLGILNSQLLSLCYKRRAVKSQRRVFPKVVIRNLREFPCPELEQGTRKTRMVRLVERMVQLHGRLDGAATAHQKTVLQRQIEATDREIDRLVYELYGLSDEEIAIVEEATRS